MTAYAHSHFIFFFIALVVHSMIEDTWQTIFSILENEHRRRVLATLLEHESRDDEIYVSETVYTQGEELDVLQAKLIHIHLPKLEAAGYIRWQKEDHRITKGPKFDEISAIFQLIHNNRDELPSGWI